MRRVRFWATSVKPLGIIPACGASYNGLAAPQYGVGWFGTSVVRTMPVVPSSDTVAAPPNWEYIEDVLTAPPVPVPPVVGVVLGAVAAAAAVVPPPQPRAAIVAPAARAG